jgi:hypothetical protein
VTGAKDGAFRWDAAEFEQVQLNDIRKDWMIHDAMPSGSYFARKGNLR